MTARATGFYSNANAVMDPDGSPGPILSMTSSSFQGAMMTDHHAFRHEPRKALTDQQRVKLFLERGERCEATGEGSCGNRKLRSGTVWHVDHIIALENGGTNDPANLQILCSWCHKSKSAEDHGKAAKMRAVAVSTYLPRSQRTPKGRPMMGTVRSGWRKRMDGTPERR